MRKRGGTSASGIAPGTSHQFGEFTVTMLSQTVTHPLQSNIADYFNRTSGGNSCCRSCGELSKPNLFLFGENIYCARCSNEMKRFYMESYKQKEDMREKALACQRELDKPQSAFARTIVIRSPVSSPQASETSTVRTRARGFSSVLAISPHSRLTTALPSSAGSGGAEFSSPLCSPVLK
ncbi:predicted protein [Naegleria gruberi]|uniref:Predicted protein n=1 Tax=Naegleria gruberi TaxID=5762 RepID=D2V4C3_NAEGR|nr:uncharacterized protein NAEGRDRAFT_63673 [Naegleria gruberi]EFC48359.1 predicted protein [Naegleria gruberi]|eukprot:XP_002681103.1 predicted protein [Naegleria gruberi strain NEG-M]